MGDHTPAVLRRDINERRIYFDRALAYDRFRLGICLGANDNGATGGYDRSLLSGNSVDRVSQNLRVFERDWCDHCQLLRLEDICAVDAPAQADLNYLHVHRLALEGHESQPRKQVERHKVAAVEAQRRLTD